MSTPPAVLFAFLFAISGSFAPASRAQTQQPAPAPAPAQILSAKTIFMDSGAESGPNAGRLGEFSAGPDRSYNEFYTAMKVLPRFALVPFATVVIVVKRGAPAHATVTNVKKAGMMGKAGELSIRLEYLKSDDQRLRLRGSKGKEGEGKVGSAAALTVLFGPIGLIKHGKNVDILPGTPLTAHVDP
jgi:hypothetical protein